jgi:hypothetical protein
MKLARERRIVGHARRAPGYINGSRMPRRK